MPRSKKVRITKRVVDAAVSASGRDVRIADLEVPGFGLRLRDGRKTYELRYGAGRDGRSRRVVIGDHGAAYKPDADGRPRTLTAELAREEALRLFSARVEGRDPADARAAARAMPTVAEFVGALEPVEDAVLANDHHRRITYMRDHVEKNKKGRSAEEDRGNLRRHVLPRLGGMRLDKVTTATAVRFHNGLRKTPTTANRCLALLSHILTMARTWGVLPPSHVNPCTRAFVPRFEEKKHERWLQPDELPRVGDAMREAEKNSILPWHKRPEKALVVESTTVDALRTIIFTGARPTEIITLEHELVRTEIGVVNQDSKTGRRPIYLNEYAVAVLEKLPRVPGNPYLFPGRRLGEHITLSGLEGAWKRIRKAAQVEDVRLYDLRHTFASVGVGDGESLYLVGSLLGHKDPRTTMRYAHLGASSQRAASGRIAGRIGPALKKA
jgi:integrase